MTQERAHHPHHCVTPGTNVSSRGTSTHLNGLLCLFFSFKFNKSKALWVPSTFVTGDTDVNYIATLPKHPLDPTVIDIFGKQLLKEKKNKTIEFDVKTLRGKVSM